MRKFLLSCVVFALSSAAALPLRAAFDPADRFLEAYFLIQEADAAERNNDWARAASKYTAALQLLHEIHAARPDWNPHIIEFRRNYCNEQLAALQPKLAAAAAPAPAAAAAAAADDTDPVRELTAELQRAREQIRELQAAREQLTEQLQQALRQVGPMHTTPQIEELLRQNRELAAQLAAAQTEIAALRQRAAAAAAEPAPVPAPTESAELARLRAELADARAQLQSTKAELEQTRAELNRTREQLQTAQAENRDLRRSYEQLVAELTEANRKLAAARAASEKDNEIIAQLRKENALLRLIADRKVLAARQPEPENVPTIPELKGWRPRRWQSARRPQPVAPAAAAVTEQPAPARERLVARLTAPPPPPAEQPAATQPTRSAEAAPAAAAAPPAAEAPARAPAPEPVRAATAETRAMLNEARAALALKDFEGAAAKYSSVLGQEPDNVTALSNLAAIRYQQGRLEEAEALLRKAVAAAPNDSAARALLGVVYFRRGLIEDAFNELTRAVALDPRNAEAHNYLGIVLAEKGWSTAGEQEIRRAIELNPQYADAHFNLAVLYAKARTPRLELARYHYHKALDLGAAPDAELERLLKPAPSTAEPKQ